jgi:hypothetical protein
MTRPPHFVLPDVELIATAYLRSHPAIEALGAGVSTELPSPIALPYVTLQRIGGIPVEGIWLDEAHLSISCWGTDKANAYTLAATARAALLDMTGHRDDAGYVTAVTDLSGLVWVPDTSADPTLPRYVFGLAVYTHP